MNNTKTRKINNETAEMWADSLLRKNPILLSKLKNILLDKGNSSRELLIEVVKFMYLVSVFDIKLSPSLIVDLGWHEFILFTKAYQRFCNQEMGRFIHHVPDDDNASNNRAYLKTIQCYINQFGQPPEYIWGRESHEEWSDSQCGSCKSN
jgi:hypothetical protein